MGTAAGAAEQLLLVCPLCVEEPLTPHLHDPAYCLTTLGHSPQGAATLGLSLRQYLSQLKAAGLGSLPGTAAEVLDDGVRALLCPDKLNTQQWLEVVETGTAATRWCVWRACVCRTQGCAAAVWSRPLLRPHPSACCPLLIPVWLLPPFHSGAVVLCCCALLCMCMCCATAHDVGLPTTSTLMFGHIDSPAAWARHLLALRGLQAASGGITEFVPLPFVHMEAPMYLAGAAR